MLQPRDNPTQSPDQQSGVVLPRRRLPLHTVNPVATQRTSAGTHGLGMDFSPRKRAPLRACA